MDFYEDDEPLEDVLRAWNAPGEKGLTARDAEATIIQASARAIAPKRFPYSNGFACQHASITAGGSARLLSASSACGCTMQPAYATTA